MTPDVEARVARAKQIAIELNIAQARLRGDIETIVRLAGLAALDAILNHERQACGEKFRDRLEKSGFIA